ncbi:2-oxo acid dehydrogenase subunit E2 [Desulfopila sp. IMCC35006]|uniref:dihydrolipoamide acetyltransferase family protein n=1 Tax=Desulfopila sp. IMCC35006 TaxID=2569542 RepID=UPI0010AD2C99|nr:dihydrolipoamide acetyltransferase family protein [Desulfopila sp. IMCC35006]TKB26865.1 2-oxo acid dehydrogenase subunit E2 [Desulfopila sp. IMCC35006]
MTTSFRLPDLGEGVHEAEILALPVTIGQAVAEGDVIMEIETDKAAVEIPSPYTGTVQEIMVKVGDMAVVGDVLITFATDTVQDTAPPPGDGSPHQKKKEAKPADQQPAAQERKRSPVPASPSTRRLARELDVDLYAVTPTGTGGIVTKEDVEAYAKKKPALDATGTVPEPPAPAEPTPAEAAPPLPAGRTTLPDFSRWGKIERRPFRSIRRATAAQMTSSWTQIPHVHCQDDVDITKLEAFRQKHKSEIEAAGGRLTMTLFAIKAVATALKNYPYFNASLDLQSQEIIIKRFFNIGIAVDTEKGLMVPVIKDVDRKSIKELAVEVHGAIERVRTGTHSREEMQGGTFTITNAGALGGSHFSAIINHPEVAILGLGQGRMQPAVVTDERGRHEIVPRLIMPIVLCFDHRVVDGADAVRFLRLVIDALEDPDELLMTMI